MPDVIVRTAVAKSGNLYAMGAIGSWYGRVQCQPSTARDKVGTVMLKDCRAKAAVRAV